MSKELTETKQFKKVKINVCDEDGSSMEFGAAYCFMDGDQLTVDCAPEEIESLMQRPDEKQTKQSQFLKRVYKSYLNRLNSIVHEMKELESNAVLQVEDSPDWENFSYILHALNMILKTEKENRLNDLSLILELEFNSELKQARERSMERLEIMIAEAVKKMETHEIVPIKNKNNDAPL